MNHTAIGWWSITRAEARLQRLLVEFGDKITDIRAVGGFWKLFFGGQ